MTPKRRKPARKGRAPRPLSAEQMRRLAKPLSNYEELVRRAVTSWKRVPGLKVAGLTPARLRALLAKAEALQDREDALRKRLEPILKRAQDARLQGAAAAWRGLLRVHDYATTTGKDDPDVAREFAFLKKALTRGGKGKPRSGPAPQA